MAACASQGSSYSAVILVPAAASAFVTSPSSRKVSALRPSRTVFQSAALRAAASAGTAAPFLSDFGSADGACQVGTSAAAARRACQVLSATTPTAAADPASEGSRTTPRTPGIASAALSSSAPSTASRCGACTSAANSMPGSRTSPA